MKYYYKIHVKHVIRKNGIYVVLDRYLSVTVYKITYMKGLIRLSFIYFVDEGK